MEAAEPLRSSRPAVTIKGSKEGLTFVLDEQALFADVVADLKDKLEDTHRHFLSGPDVVVHIQTGQRELSEDEQSELRTILSAHPNLRVQDFLSTQLTEPKTPIVFRGTVRSGQVISGTGDVVIVGDVNPGGQVVASGSVYVMGHLRGLAHAGCEGDAQAIIAAVKFQPTQLRIDNVISRPPDVWETKYAEAMMEFAYLRDGQMSVEKMNRIPVVRPGGA